MEINPEVPLPKKLEKTEVPHPGLPLPPKPETPVMGEQLPKVNLNPAQAQKVEVVFRPSENVPPLRMAQDPSRPNIQPATIQRIPETNVPPLRMAQDSGRPNIQPTVFERPIEESARLAGSGFDLEKIKKDAKARVPNGLDKPTELPPKLRAFGNREEKVFEPAGSSIPTFVAADNTQIKLSEKLFSKQMGPATIKACGVQFEAPKIGQPMMRRVKIVWPTPMEKAPTKPQVPLQGVEAGNDDFPASFPGQALPTGAQPVKLQERTSQAQIPMPKRPEPKFMGLQDPPRLGPRSSEGEGRPSVDEILAAAQKHVESLIAKTAGTRNMNPADILAELAGRAPEGIMADIAKRAQAIMSSEAKARDLEVENAALREVVKTLGGKVAIYEAELQILKAKKG